MRVTLSAAITADGFIDDGSEVRLQLSTPEDWAEVYRLRALHDAILVGAETIRRDNPSLLIRDEDVRRERIEEGLKPDIAKVTLTASGNLAATRKFFTAGESEHYVFATRALPDLENCATVIRSDEPISARLIVTELEKRGIRSLFVEGGAHVLRLFLSEDMADTLRLAVNPALRVGTGTAFTYSPKPGTPSRQEQFGTMEVSTWALHPDTSEKDVVFLRQAIAESRRCSPSATSYCVGAVVVTSDNRTFTGYTHETSSTHHAEQEAIAKAIVAGACLRGAAMYSSMEPCSRRASEPESCSQLLIRHGFARAVFALYEPDHFVCCRGALSLREAGLDVRCYPALGKEVLAVNKHLWQ